MSVCRKLVKARSLVFGGSPRERARLFRHADQARKAAARRRAKRKGKPSDY